MKSGQATIKDYYLFLILVIAFILRLVGITFGTYHPDEHLVINHSLAFGTGDLNPHMFYYPTFFMYLLFFIYGVFYVLGSVFQAFQGTEDFLAFYLMSPQTFYILGRFASVVFGTLTVWAVYRLGNEYKNIIVGRCAALFFSCMFPAHA